MNRPAFRDPALNASVVPPAQGAPDTPSLYLSQVHSQAVLCSHLARLLHHALTDLDWPFLRFSDRSRLERALTRLGNDIPLVWLIAGQPQNNQTQNNQTQNKQSAVRAAEVPSSEKHKL